jgi:hypothetical protein
MVTNDSLSWMEFVPVIKPTAGIAIQFLPLLQKLLPTVKARFFFDAGKRIWFAAEGAVVFHNA